MGLLPGSQGNPVHLGGGFQIENMDAFGMTIGALVIGLISLVLSVSALVIAILSLVKAGQAADRAIEDRKNQ
eukprot:CAMPEP_0177689710 /NCGR_PEP_ID=MMETSP0484_2-20121128/352_1 /TAXON_ID=354590 /ORGANISM="Rhodomonas lens, Strain RHODO" /LENGTH=71 /DNA_ID=CAMNT_0019200153 /DNA_START=17 /DNA_END=232 /DNA_ORIENTATION=+